MAARILIVEDNPANLELMTYLLGASGYPTLSARDGVDGLRIAIEELPDLIICDVQLPKMSGYGVAQQVKRSKDLCGIPLIAITAFARVSDRAEALAAGFDGYFSKPIDPEIFVQQLEAFLRPDLRLKAAGTVLVRHQSDSKASCRERERFSLSTMCRPIWICPPACSNIRASRRLLPEVRKKRYGSPAKPARTSSCPIFACLNPTAMTSSRKSRTTIDCPRFLSFSLLRRQRPNETGYTGLRLARRNSCSGPSSRSSC